MTSDPASIAPPCEAQTRKLLAGLHPACVALLLVPCWLCSDDLPGASGAAAGGGRGRPAAVRQHGSAWPAPRGRLQGRLPPSPFAGLCFRSVVWVIRVIQVVLPADSGAPLRSVQSICLAAKHGSNVGNQAGGCRVGMGVAAQVAGILASLEDTRLSTETSLPKWFS
jgi:hypothetical protein